MSAPFVYKICSTEDLRAAERVGQYAGSADDLRDGFVHLSLVEQLLGTLSAHFAQQSDLRLLAVDAQALGEPLRYEPSRSGALFPHYYGPLPMSAVRAVVELPDDAYGRAKTVMRLSAPPI